VVEEFLADVKKTMTFQPRVFKKTAAHRTRALGSSS
jgi:hypothetical protein